jgi:hypothetical protein
MRGGGGIIGQYYSCEILEGEDKQEGNSDARDEYKLIHGLLTVELRGN